MMWLFTRFGFFSSVRDHNSNQQLIRARCVAHLERLKEEYPELIGEYDIITDEGTDYAARIRVPSVVWLELSDSLAQDATTYDNFKDAAFETGISKGYDIMLHEIWSLGIKRLAEIPAL
jgi:hypothetical protein